MVLDCKRFKSIAVNKTWFNNSSLKLSLRLSIEMKNQVKMLHTESHVSKKPSKHFLTHFRLTFQILYPLKASDFPTFQRVQKWNIGLNCVKLSQCGYIKFESNFFARGISDEVVHGYIQLAEEIACSCLSLNLLTTNVPIIQKPVS